MSETSSLTGNQSGSEQALLTPSRARAAFAAFLSSRLPGILLIVGLLVLWEVSARFWVDSQNWPPVTAVLASLVKGLGSSELPLVFASSLYRMLVGLAEGAVLGIAVGLAMGMSRFVFAALEPVVEFLRPLPIPGIIPPLILLMGIDDTMKIFIVAFSTFFPMVINTAQGVRAVDATLLATARTFRKSRFATLRGIIFPASLPYIFSGLRISLSLALIVTVVGEMISGSEGIGYYLLQMQYAMRPADMYACVVLIGLTGYLLSIALMVIEKKVLAWYLQSD